MKEHTLHNLFAYLHSRIKAGHRVLKNHSDLLPVNSLAQVFFCQRQQVLAVVENIAAVDNAVAVEKSDDGFHGNRLAGAALADKRDSFSFGQVKINAAYRVNVAGICAKRYVEIFNRQNNFFQHELNSP